jgi:tRNA modification GTPase
VTAEICIPSLAATIIDTAGLDPALAATGIIDQAAQHKSVEALRRSDLILLILDASQPVNQLPDSVAVLLVGRKTIVVLNKADLPQRFDSGSLPAHLQHTVHISAKQETGIEDLFQAIHETCGVLGIAPDTVVTFTDRQRILIERLAIASSPSEAASSVVELLLGRVT